jgi:hypothetical protein
MRPVVPSSYEQLPGPALIGMQATGNSQWFIDLVEELGQVGG